MRLVNSEKCDRYSTKRLNKGPAPESLRGNVYEVERSIAHSLDAFTLF
jgi:hypothetical protein